MHVKRLASKMAPHGEIASDDSSSGEDEQFVISPRPRRATTRSSKAACGSEGSSSRADEEAARVVEGRVMAVAREAWKSDVNQQVECLLKPVF
jgi:hypothetical protein